MPRGIMVHLTPDFLKLFDAVIANWQLTGLGLANERINQDRNEEVDEDLSHDDFKARKENQRSSRISTVICNHPIIDDVLKLLVRLTLEHDTLGASKVVHDVAGFAGSRAEQQKEGVEEVLEVAVVIDGYLVCHVCEAEEAHSNDAVHKYHKH